MNWTDYLNSLKKASIKDIVNIIKEDLNTEEFICYGFIEQRKTVFFGKLSNGKIVNPYLLTFENENILPQELYDTLQSQLPNTFHYECDHNFAGEYDYYGYTDNQKFAIQFPNLNQMNQKWIFDKVNSDKKENGKTY